MVYLILSAARFSLELLLVADKVLSFLSDHVSACVLTDKLFEIQLQQATLSAGSLAEGIGLGKSGGFITSDYKCKRA
jgi:hypothetical protein